MIVRFVDKYSVVNQFKNGSCVSKTTTGRPCFWHFSDNVFYSVGAGINSIEVISATPTHVGYPSAFIEFDLRTASAVDMVQFFMPYHTDATISGISETNQPSAPTYAFNIDTDNMGAVAPRTNTLIPEGFCSSDEKFVGNQVYTISCMAKANAGTATVNSIIIDYAGTITTGTAQTVSNKDWKKFQFEIDASGNTKRIRAFGFQWQKTSDIDAEVDAGYFMMANGAVADCVYTGDTWQEIMPTGSIVMIYSNNPPEGFEAYRVGDVDLLLKDSTEDGGSETHTHDGDYAYKMIPEKAWSRFLIRKTGEHGPHTWASDSADSHTHPGTPENSIPVVRSAYLCRKL